MFLGIMMSHYERLVDTAAGWSRVADAEGASEALGWERLTTKFHPPSYGGEVRGNVRLGQLWWVILHNAYIMARNDGQ